jgi:hypothetical protein
MLLLCVAVIGCAPKDQSEPAGAAVHPMALTVSQSGTMDIGAQINASCAIAVAEGIPVEIDAGEFCVQTQVNPISGCTIEGAGSSNTTLKANTDDCPGLGSIPLIHVAGTASARISNVTIRDLALRNGTPTASSPSQGMDGIRVDNCDDCTFQSLFIHDIAGYFGIIVKDSTYIVASNNRVASFDYAGIVALTGSQYVWFTDNDVSGAVNRTALDGHAYGIAISGYEAPGITGPFTQHGWVINNIVSNIPTWECYDTHGGSDQHFINNKGSGCYFGIQSGTVDNSQYSVLDDLEIAGNDLDRGDGRADGYGIVVAGASLSHPVTRARVIGNTVRNYGSSTSTEVGAITIYDTRDVTISDNSIPTYYQSAILLDQENWNVVLTGNVGGDVLGGKYAIADCMILLDNIGNWGLFVDQNASMPSRPELAPPSFLCNYYAANQVTIGPNNTATVPCAFWGTDYLPLCLNHLPSASDPWLLNFVDGDIGDSPDHQTKYVFHAPPDSTGGYYSMDTVHVIASGETTAGSATMTGLGGGLAGGVWFRWLPTGMNIVVDGAGVDGAPLRAQVKANDGETLTLSAPASISVPDAGIRWQGGSVSQLPP